MLLVKDHFDLDQVHYKDRLFQHDEHDTIIKASYDYHVSGERSKDEYPKRLAYKLSIIPYSPDCDLDNFEKQCDICYSSSYIIDHSHETFNICIYCFRIRLDSKCPQCSKTIKNISYKGSQRDVLLIDSEIYLNGHSKLIRSYAFDGSTSLGTVGDIIAKYSRFSGVFLIKFNNINITFNEVSVLVEDESKPDARTFIKRYDEIKIEMDLPMLSDGCDLRLMRFYNNRTLKNLYIAYYTVVISALNDFSERVLLNDGDLKTFGEKYCYMPFLNNNDPYINLSKEEFWRFIRPSFMRYKSSFIVTEESNDFDIKKMKGSDTERRFECLDISHKDFEPDMYEFNDDYAYLFKTIDAAIPSNGDHGNIYLDKKDFIDYRHFFDLNRKYTLTSDETMIVNGREYCLIY